jgi:O-antigen biosynthesis protein
MLNRIKFLFQRSLWTLRRQGFRVLLQKAVRFGSLYISVLIKRVFSHNRKLRNPTPVSLTYAQWISENEPGEQELEKQRSFSKELSYQPKISILVPVFDAPLPILADLINSVITQTYDNWELCISNGSSGDKPLAKELDKYTNIDSRIRVVHLSENLEISGNSNQALDMASGEFVALLDQSDTLAPFALYEIALLLQEAPELDLIYSDHDALSADGKTRLWPLFKPDWSPEIMFSTNYIAHLTILRTTLVRQAGGFDSSTDGAQDWDLFFRVINTTHRIAHIPKILYHWRETPQSSASNRSATPYVAQAQLAVIEKQLKRKGLAEVNSLIDPQGYIHVKWSTQREKVSIIIPTRGVSDLLKNCISSILERTDYPDFEIIIVNNGSDKPEKFPYFGEIVSNPRIKVLHYEGNFNFSRVNNFGVAHAQGKYILLLNNDIEVVSEDWLNEMVLWASLPEIGAVGAKLLRPNGLIQHAGAIVGMGGFAGHIFADLPENASGIFGSVNWYRNFSALTAACLMIRKDVYTKLGGLNEGFLLNGNDVELGLRLNGAGYRLLYNPFVVLKHIESATHQGQIPAQDFRTSYIYYRNILSTGDPFFSPNLSYWSSKPVYRSKEEKQPIQFVDEFLASTSKADETTATSEYFKEAVNFTQWYDVGYRDIEESQKIHDIHPGKLDIKSVSWFIPVFQNPFYGGIFTIFRFANYLKNHYGISQQFLLTSSLDDSKIKNMLSEAFPALSDSSVLSVVIDDDWRRIPPTDVTISTLWATAYFSLRFNKTKRKFYFIQDYEPMFYPAGSMYGQAEATYHFGFYGLINTPGLCEVYQTQYNNQAEYFLPCVDTSLFFPDNNDRREKKHFTVFFYGRPGHRRNAFELGAAALKKLKKKFGDQISIISAGSEWDPKDYGLEGTIINLGILTLPQTACLYRTCDVGLAMMFTKHPSYLPFEFMASGCLVVSNKNASTKWFLQDGHNCMLTDATPSCIAETIEKALLDSETRSTIVENAHRMILEQFSDWDKQMEKIYRFMIDPENS